jgi:F-type H+-transporting ATPase subunit beta
MTAQLNEQGTAAKAGATGRIARVIGPVVDVEFPADGLPAIYNALSTEITLNGQTTTITFETSQHLGDGVIRAIALQATDGLVRGSIVWDLGSPITVPVGDGVKGHIFNVLGEPLDVPASELTVTERWPIHRKPPAFAALEGSTEMLETGIKSIDLLTPYIKGGKIGLFGGAGVGKTVLIHLLFLIIFTLV